MPRPVRQGPGILVSGNPLARLVATDGTKHLEWAVRQPQCDPATAVTIYFRAQPAYHSEHQGRSRDEVRTRKWLKSIEARFANRAFNGATVAYEPEKDVGFDDVASEYVPQAMKLRARPVKGSPAYRFRVRASLSAR